MAWTAPSTATVGQVYTASFYNTQTRDNLKALSRPYFTKTTPKAVTNTVTQTDLLNGELTVAAGDLGTSGKLIVRGWGDFINNSGAARDVPRFAVVYVTAGTAIDTGVPAGTGWAASAGRYPFRFLLEITNLGAANSQLNYFSVFGAGLLNAAGTTQANFTTGEGVYYLDSGQSHAEGILITSFDTSVAVTIAVTVQNATATATYETKLLGAVAELLP